MPGAAPRRMLYVCRSCLLRLGRPWQTSTCKALRSFHATSLCNRLPDQVEASTTTGDSSGSPTNTSPSSKSKQKYHPARRALAATYLRKTWKENKEAVREVLGSDDLNAKAIEFVDRRVNFMMEMDNAEDPAFVSKLVSRMRSLEQHQMNRLVDWAPQDLQQTFLYAFYQWKAFIKTIGPGLSATKSGSSSQPRAESRIKWIQTCQTVEEMVTTIPPARHTSEVQRQDSGLVKMALQYAPNKVHMVLECIFRTHQPHSTYAFYVFEDTLDLLAARLHSNEVLDKRTAAQELADLVSLLVTETDRQNHFQPFQSTIWSILHFLPLERVRTWYEELRSASCHLFPHTELQFASRFAKSHNTKTLSIEIMRRQKALNRIDINGPAAMSVSTSILKFTQEELENTESGLPTPAEIFEALRGINLNPNNFTYGVILRALCLRGGLDTAMEVFGVMKQQGLKPDAFTYSILVNGCRHSEAWETLADLAVEASRAGIRSPVMWNDVIYALFVLCKSESEYNGYRPALAPLNTLFTRIFDTTTLRPFIAGRTAEAGAQLVGLSKDAWFPDRLRRLEREIAPLPSLELLKPGLDTLSIMIMCIVRNLPHPYDIVIFYAQFKKLLEEGHADTVRLVQERGTLIYDIVIRSLLAWRGTMRVVLEIIRDMLKDTDLESKDSATTSLPEAAGHERMDTIETAGTIRPPAPSVYTWSILIRGFMKNKQHEKAEQCIDLMRKYGVEPDIATWNSMAAGYAHSQDVYGTVHSMRRLETAGFKANAWTMRAFSILRNKRLAVKMMENAVEANRLNREREEVLRLQSEYDLPAEQIADSNAEERDAVEMASLDVDLDDRFLELDPGTVPTDISNHMMDKVDPMTAQDQDKTTLLPKGALEEVDAELAKLDVSGAQAVPDTYWKRYHRIREKLKQIAPVNDKAADYLKEWARVRDGGLAYAPPPESLEGGKLDRWRR